jgi:hypothetical protein
MSDGFSFIGAALAVIFFAWIGMSVWDCGLHAPRCMVADMDCLAGDCHRP